MQLAKVNNHLFSESETIFIKSKESWTYISSKLIKEIGQRGGDLSHFIPICILDKVMQKMNNISNETKSKF